MQRTNKNKQKGIKNKYLRSLAKAKNIDIINLNRIRGFKPNKFETCMHCKVIRQKRFIYMVHDLRLLCLQCAILFCDSFSLTNISNVIQDNNKPKINTDLLKNIIKTIADKVSSRTYELLSLLKIKPAIINKITEVNEIIDRIIRPIMEIMDPKRNKNIVLI